MSKSTISTFELFAMFPDQETARVYLEGRLWPHGPKCPVCGLGERITARAGGYYRCNQCKEDFTVRTGTIFERSHVPLHKWIYAIYLLVTARKGISSMQLAKEIGITQKSAWFVLGRLREACGDEIEKLQGIIEIDEAYIGGLEKNKHGAKKANLGSGTRGKTAVLAMRQRGGNTIAMPIESADQKTIFGKIGEHVQPGSTLHTDDAGMYRDVDGGTYSHAAVNHSAGEYVRDGVTTNGVESVFAVMRRGLHGVYHHASKKHLHRYVDEFAFRLNEGNVNRHTLDRLDSFVSKTAGKRLTYKGLTK
ncbi:MAG TPA: IS1595 family transposase [Rhizomicrobium sp.]|jgi:transposase-like protein